jgi:hypothetical protein
MMPIIDPYRTTASAKPTVSPGPRLLDADEVAFWERLVCAMEASPVLVDGVGKVSQVVARADAFVLLRRERLPPPKEG